MPVDPPFRVRIPIAELTEGDSPRLAGEDHEYIKLLADVEASLPPVLVHRPTMRVIDGMHRVRAALLRGEETIEAELLDCDDAEAFVIAVKANIKHGRPLTLADREAAAARIIGSHQQCSDRWVATITGLAPRTVAAVRGRLSPGGDQGARIGRDGRVRRLDSADARRKASELIRTHPDASLRDVARQTGLSPTTVRDVRERLRRGDDPVPVRPRGTGHTIVAAGSGRDELRERRRFEPSAARDHRSLMQSLNRDPSLRFSESGRGTLRWLFSKATGPDGWEKHIEGMPAHCKYVVAEIARGCAEEWLALADRLEQNQRNTA